MHDELISFKNEMRTFYQDQLNQIKTNTGFFDQLPIMERVLNKSADREKRAKNVLCYNVEECSNPDIKIRVSEDKSLLAGALSSFCNVNLGSAKIIRLRKVKSDAPRPIKIIFSSSKEAMAVLQNKKLYKGHHRFASNLTVHQRSYYKSVRNKLNDLHSQGDTRKQIKFVNGIPTIVDFNSNSSEANNHSASGLSSPKN